MGLIDDIRDTVMDWINSAIYAVQSYAYGLYSSVWSYASQISTDLWHESSLIWDRIGAIPVLTKDVIEGWVTPWIKAAKDYALDLVNDVIDIFDPLINALDVAVITLEGWKEEVVDVTLSQFSTWIVNAPSWFSVQLESSKDKIADFIIDRFEYILDEVFKEDKK